MATVRTLTGHSVGAMILVKVRAHNANGWGGYSALNTVGARIETEPVQMAPPVFDAATSTTTSAVLTWTALSGNDAGGAGVPISNYVVEWLPPSATVWATVATTSSTTATISGLSGGLTYQFRVYADNKYGDGLVSTDISAIPAVAPDTPAAPTTT